MSEVATQDFTAAEAREFVDHVRASVEDLKDWIVRAVKGRAWIALGYGSWDEMCEAEFDGAVIRLPREDRREAVASLREAGLSTRAIGSALGVDHKTVVNDVRSTGENSPVPETVTSLDGRERPATQVRRDPDPEPEPEPQGPEHDDKRPDPEPGIWYSGPPAPNPIAAAVKEARTAPSHIAGKAVDEIKLVGDIIARAGGVDAILADLEDSALDDTIADAWLLLIDPVADQLDRWRSGLRRRRLRSVQ